jgi:hypothetical protein
MPTTTNDIKQRCVDLAKAEIEGLAEYDKPEDYHVLDIELTQSMDGDIREVTLTTATGGPHVEVELFNEVVSVSWGSERVRRIVRDDDAKDTLEHLRQHYSNTKPSI